MKIKLLYVELFVGEITPAGNIDPRPGDYLTIFSKDEKKQFRYRVVRKDYQCSETGQDSCLVLHVDPANNEASSHVQSLVKADIDKAIEKKHPYAHTCPDCRRDMLKIHRVKDVETWRCSSCSQDIIQSREKGVIEISGLTS